MKILDAMVPSPAEMFWNNYGAVIIAGAVIVSVAAVMIFAAYAADKHKKKDDKNDDA